MLKTITSFVDSLGSLTYKGLWNAATNTPTLASGVGTTGDYYVVSVPGTTTLDGISSWAAGDWAIFNGSVWEKYNNPADTLGEVLANGNTTAGTDISVTTGDDITFANNSKAIFGDGSDLQIYSDGFNSYIQEGAGTSGIRITTDNSVSIRKHDDENIAVFNVDGAVRLYHDSAERIATTATGIDVTGTATMDGLTTNGASEGDTYFTGGTASSRLLNVFTSTHDGATNSGHNFKIASGQGAFIFGNNTTANLLTVKSGGIDVTGTASMDGISVTGLAAISSTTPEIRMFETDTTDLNTQLRNGVGKFEIKTLNDAVTLAKKRFEIDHATGDISFYNDATAQGLFWDSSASRLGLGTTTPVRVLDIATTTGGTIIHLTDDATTLQMTQQDTLQPTV
jgi:hypothetical protein